jgi:hypothetical protein
MYWVVTHREWGVLARPSVPAAWLPWTRADAMTRAHRFGSRSDAVRAATRTWDLQHRDRFRIVEVDAPAPPRAGRRPPPPRG